MTIISVFIARCFWVFIFVPFYLLCCVVNFILSLLFYFIPFNRKNSWFKTIYTREEGIVKGLIHDLLFITYIF